MTIFTGIRIRIGVPIGTSILCLGMAQAHQGRIVPRHGSGSRLWYVAGRQDAGSRWAGGNRAGGWQAATKRILTHFSQICINFYVNEARRRKPGMKFCRLFFMVKCELILRQCDWGIKLIKRAFLKENLGSNTFGLENFVTNVYHIMHNESPEQWSVQTCRSLSVLNWTWPFIVRIDANTATYIQYWCRHGHS